MENVLKDKSFAFALRVLKLAKYLNNRKNEYILGKQVLGSGTAIGALVCEAEFAQSKQDFIHKLSIALKEANETYYWIRLLHEGDYISRNMYDSLQPQTKELIRLLVTSIKTTKENIQVK